MKNIKAILFAGVLTFLLTFTMLCVKDAITPTMDAYTWTETTHKVRAGETLWSIADEYRPEDVDRREYIEAVADLNGIDAGMIYAGDNITVLIPE